ncbi:MAG: hypothetical protein QQN63_12995, partial [Nitrosopumilus sp.]
ENNPNEGGQQGNEEGNQNQSGEGSQGASEFDASKMTADDFAKLLDRDDIQATLMKSESVRRAIQSEKDKELARESRKRLEQDRAASIAETERLDRAEKQALIDEGDLKGLGQKEADKIAQEKLDSESATRVDKVIETTLRNNPEFQSLGEDKIDEIYRETIRSKGNVVDFSTALSREKTRQSVDAAVVESTKGLDEKVAEIVEARLIEAKLIERSDASKGDAPNSAITADTANRSNIKLDSKEEISLAYGSGDISTKEFKRKMEQFNLDD